MLSLVNVTPLETYAGYLPSAYIFISRRNSKITTKPRDKLQCSVLWEQICSFPSPCLLCRHMARQREPRGFLFYPTSSQVKNMKMHSCQDVSHTIIESKLILIRKTTSIRKGVRACQSWVVSPVLAFTNCVIWNEGLKHWKAFVSSSAKAGVNTPSRVAAETNAWRARGS